MFEYLVIGWAAVLGLLLGWAMSRANSKRVLVDARARATALAEDARQDVDARLRAAETNAREEALQVRASSEELERQSSDEIALLEERIGKLQARNEKREADSARRQSELEHRDAAAGERRTEARRVRAEARELGRSFDTGLEGRAGQTADETRARLMEGLVEETRAQCADRLRNLEGSETEELVRQAKRIMGISMGRYAGHFLTERMSSLITLPDGGAARLAPHTELLEQQTGVHLALGDSGDSLRLEGGDGTARELARRCVARFSSEKKVRDPDKLLKSVRAELDREIIDNGRKAFEILGLEPAHAEILRLLGRLNYRTSYTQNQWQHALEAAFIAGLMAAELGLDVVTARRATLLHDIGKALTHEVEGSHAVIGAEYARKFGENELVANAIGSHHGDEPAQSAYAHLVAAADAMSGARPGARREMVETYVERIADLERIATGFKGVLMVHAVQAGREIRVHVDEAKVSDQRAGALSERIAAKISDDLTFPGQIRVTVIREFKAVEIAS